MKYDVLEILEIGSGCFSYWGPAQYQNPVCKTHKRRTFLGYGKRGCSPRNEDKTCFAAPLGVTGGL